jgi:hypothetical protein
MIFYHGHPNFGGKGFVYKIDSENFIYAGGTQWVCPSPVVPLEIIEIKVDEHLDLFRYATTDEQREIEYELSKIDR